MNAIVELRSFASNPDVTYMHVLCWLGICDLVPGARRCVEQKPCGLPPHTQRFLRAGQSALLNSRVTLSRGDSSWAVFFLYSGRYGVSFSAAFVMPESDVTMPRRDVTTTQADDSPVLVVFVFGQRQFGELPTRGEPSAKCFWYTRSTNQIFRRLNCANVSDS